MWHRTGRHCCGCARRGRHSNGRRGCAGRTRRAELRGERTRRCYRRRRSVPCCRERPGSVSALNWQHRSCTETSTMRGNATGMPYVACCMLHDAMTLHCVPHVVRRTCCAACCTPHDLGLPTRMRSLTQLTCTEVAPPTRPIAALARTLWQFKWGGNVSSLLADGPVDYILAASGCDVPYYSPDGYHRVPRVRIGRPTRSFLGTGIPLGL
jgi:hypothetical protein